MQPGKEVTKDEGDVEWGLLNIKGMTMVGGWGITK
jgi:hypothetical protein